VPSSAPPSPCDPPAASGYLGADNQLIRVQVTAFDANKGIGTLLWGYHNAAILYRAVIESAMTLRLETRPVATEYEPRLGQVVQVLSRAASFGEDAFAAALTGHFAKLATAYAADTQIVTLPGALPAAPPFASTTNVFVRLWEDQATFTFGKPVILAGTGLQVTITAASKGTLHVGDYWCVAVRPATPSLVYPERLKTTPQPPDGPRMWACPLAVLAGNGKTFTVADDCRLPFDNLVELTARKDDCACTVCVTPQGHAARALTVQDAIDTVLKAGGGTVCLEVGTYKLDKTLFIKSKAPLRLVGKGSASHLLSDDLTAIEITESSECALDSFRVQCLGMDKDGPAMLVRGSQQVRIERLQIDVAKSGSAIALRGALAEVLIRENRITANIGITDSADSKNIATGLMDLRIEENLFDCSLVAIRLANISAHQSVSRIAGNKVSQCTEAGFQITGATVPGSGVEVIGNELEVIGDGIVGGVDGLRILDNNVMPVRKEGKGRAKRAVVLTKGVGLDRLDDTQIVGNRIADFDVAVIGEVPLGSVSIARNQISATTDGILLRVGVFENLNIANNQLTDIANTALNVESKLGRIIASGNQLDTTGSVAVVSMSIPDGDCLFTHNICLFAKANESVAVSLRARTLVFASNRINGTVALAPTISAKKVHQCTVLGNITAMSIAINGTSLTGTDWEKLNLQGI
jgi:hypothetical protein